MSTEGQQQHQRQQNQQQQHTLLHGHSMLTQLKQASAGAAAGFFTRTVTQPFDVLKIRFQLQMEPVSEDHPSKYRSMMQASKLIYKEEGLFAFWKGHNAGQLLTMIYTIFQFWSYEQIDLKLRQYEYLDANKNLRHFLSGGVAGCVGTTISMPFDVVRTRVVGQDPNHRSSVIHIFPNIIRTEGFYGLFRGLGTTLIQIGPLIGFNFAFYHKTNDLFLTMAEPPNHHLPVVVHLLTGGVAGVVSKAIVYPLDFIKKRLQLQGFQNARRTFGRNQVCFGIGECIRLTYKDEGILGFYKGMNPTLIKSGLTTALYFSLYDIFKAHFVPEVESDD
uniref:Mitochondrial thiamine pyrophosphate carrier n=1 Tax=Stomoxys calcitrans TaxID=35570 RepID=A0A1I8PZF9_STOCA